MKHMIDMIKLLQEITNHQNQQNISPFMRIEKASHTCNTDKIAVFFCFVSVTTEKQNKQNPLACG